jgi:hypothetical protein
VVTGWKRLERKSTRPRRSGTTGSGRAAESIRKVYYMNSISSSQAAKAVVRRNTEEVQGKGNFDVFEELFADDFIDHTPQPGMTPNKTGCAKTLHLYACRIP